MCIRDRLEAPNFFLSQALTGHRAFGSYLYKIGKRNTPSCPCGHPSQTPEHVFLECKWYKEDRPQAWEGLSTEECRRYLIQTAKKLWEEEKEEEKTGLNRTR